MIVTISNQKGGIGKTTTAQNLGCGLAAAGYKTLLIDLDGQSNLSQATAAIDGKLSIYEVMMKKAPAAEAIQHLKDSLDIIQGSRNLAALDMELSEVGKEYRLKEALETISGQYDFIVIDTPPALGIATINALTAADTVIIPAHADIFSLDAITTMYGGTIAVVRKYTNSKLKIDGILLTRFNDRNVLTKDIMKGYEQLAEQMHTRIYNSKIRETVTIRESQAMNKDIFTYAGRSKVAADYAGFIKEFLEGK